MTDFPKDFYALAEAWDDAVADAEIRLPPVDSYPYPTIMIAIPPSQLHPINLLKPLPAFAPNINSEDSYVTFRKVICEGVVIGWEKC